jgi:hypothetical protein
MVFPETLEGIINRTLWFHYDVDGDVLYLRLASKAHRAGVGGRNAGRFFEAWR